MNVNGYRLIVGLAVVGLAVYVLFFSGIEYVPEYPITFRTIVRSLCIFVIWEFIVGVKRGFKS